MERGCLGDGGNKVELDYRCGHGGCDSWRELGQGSHGLVPMGLGSEGHGFPADSQFTLYIL